MVAILRAFVFTGPPDQREFIMGVVDSKIF